MFSLKEIVSVTLILFSIIDILGAIPIIIDLRKKAGKIESEQATIASGIIMLIFLFLGDNILKLLNLDYSSFAIAGSFIIFLIGAEMVLGIHIFKSDTDSNTSSVFPLAFPLIAGAGTMTTLLSLRAEYQLANILVGIFLNLIFVYIVLKSSVWLEQKLGPAGTNILRKVFGIILIAIAVKLFKTNILLP